jgi:WD40 repeat protein/DNA-binding XRE family transcriptional regulator
VPPADDEAGESFRDLVLRLRGRTGLTQRELATRIGVHARSIQGWEVGASYPGVSSLKALIAASLQDGGFTPGREAEEAQALWAAAVRDAPRFRIPFDAVWFEQIATGRRERAPGEATSAVAAPVALSTTSNRGRRESWGEAPDVAGFVNRVSERALVRQWVLDEGSRVVAVMGLGGIGKSLLATRLAHDLGPSFECVFWRSLREAPTPGEWLAEALRFLAPDVAPESGGEAASLRRLVELLGETRCLLVLDNVETVLQPGGPVGGYREGYERYGTLLRQVAESPHRGCLVITSREEPAELAPLLGDRGPVRTLELAGFGTEDGRALLSDKQLEGDDGDWRTLVGRYGGNGLALRVVGETTRELFGGSIADYLEYATATSGVMVGGVRQLLGAQVHRLSDVEQELLRRMAVEREPVGLAELAADLGPRISRGAVLDAVEGLRRRSLLERTVRGPLFALHSVVLEYVTEQLVEDLAHELASGDSDLLLRQPLLKATAKDYVRRSQERLIVGPILDRLVATCGGAQAAEQRLRDLLETQRGRLVEEQGYGSGNLVNLLRLLRGDLRGADLSGLAIRHAYLQEVEAQSASLAHAHLSETVVGEAFSHPTSLALSDDGAYLVAGTESGEICWWRVADRTLLVTLQGHAGAIQGVAMSGDGRLTASSGLDGIVRLWATAGGRPLPTLRWHASGALGAAVALSGDGRLVASGGVDGAVRLWEAKDGRPLATLEGHTGTVNSVALSGDGRMAAASSSVDGTVRLWDAASGRPLATLHGHTGAVRGVAVSRDGRLVASGGFDGTMRLWEAESGRPLTTLHGHAGGVGGVALSEVGRLVASGGFDGTVRLWEAESGRPLTTLHGHSGGTRDVALSEDGRLVASGGFDGTIRLWEAATGHLLAALHGYAGGVRRVTLSKDGQLVASGGFDGTIRLWEAATGRLLAALHGYAGGILGMALSGDSRLVATCGYDGTVRLRDAATGRLLAALHGHTGAVRGVALSEDGRLVASGGADRVIRLWETETGQLLATLHGHAGGIWGVALSGNGRLVATGSVDETVRLWDAEAGQPLATLHGHTGGVYCVALCEHGRLVASGGVDGTVRLWDAESGQPRATLHGHAGEVSYVALSEDGRLVASGGMDGTVRLWSAESGRPLHTLQGHGGGVWGVALSGDASIVASGGDDGAVRLWDASSGTSRHVLRGERRYEALDITGLSGITEAQRSALLALGAVDRSSQAPPSA